MDESRKDTEMGGIEFAEIVVRTKFANEALREAKAYVRSQGFTVADVIDRPYSVGAGRWKCTLAVVRPVEG
jgi:hypothetical protein